MKNIEGFGKSSKSSATVPPSTTLTPSPIGKNPSKLLRFTRLLGGRRERLRAWKNCTVTKQNQNSEDTLRKRSTSISQHLEFSADYAGVGEAEAKGIVGAVALDLNGFIAVGASTGGKGGKRPERVGDTPIAGAGYWCEQFQGNKVYHSRRLPENS
jgi:Asparaginase